MDFFHGEPIEFIEITPKSTGFLEYQYLDNSSYEECFIYTFDEQIIPSIDLLKQYPMDNCVSIEQRGMFEINKQKFYYTQGGIFLHSQKIYLVNSKNTKYLVILASMSTYNMSTYFIFDITDSESIKFFTLVDEDNFNQTGCINFKLFNNKLCFIVAKSLSNNNDGEYFAAPYSIVDGSLKELQSSDGKVFRVYFKHQRKPQFIYEIKTKTF